MIKLAIQASVLVALAFSSSVMASPLDAQYAQRGYDVLVARGAILPTSQYSAILRDAIARLHGQSLQQVSDRTGVNIRVLEKMVRLGQPIPSVDPKQVIQATIPVPETPPVKVAATPEAVPVPIQPKPKPKLVIKRRAITHKTKAKTKPKTVLASGKKLVEGYGMGTLESTSFDTPKKFKYKFRVVGNFLNDTTATAKQPESRQTAEPVAETYLSPSKRALLDLQKRHPEINESTFAAKD